MDFLPVVNHRRRLKTISHDAKSPSEAWKALSKRATSSTAGSEMDLLEDLIAASMPRGGDLIMEVYSNSYQSRRKLKTFIGMVRSSSLSNID